MLVKAIDMGPNTNFERNRAEDWVEFDDCWRTWVSIRASGVDEPRIYLLYWELVL
jgi:hypothetical protein